MISQLILLTLLLALSAFFSGSETAFFSLNHLEKEKLLAGSRGARRNFISRILSSPMDILITILTGNTVVNLFFASIMDRLISGFITEKTWLYSILIGTTLVLIFGEMAPKNLAIKQSLSFFSFSSPLLMVIHRGLTPVRFVLTKIERAIVSFITSKMKTDTGNSRDLISSAFRIGLQKGIIQKSELSILESFLDFREKTAEEVMIPRTEMQAVDISTGVDELLDSLEPGLDGLLPVYRDDIDHIMGYVNIRDLLPFRFKLQTIRSLSAVLKAVHPVPESKNLMELLREIMENRIEMALVVDEYGGTSGMVTYQTLVEDFLYFFYHPREDFKRIGEDSYIFPGNYDLSRAAEILGTEVDAESRTISGYIIEILEDIPQKGKELRVDGLLFIVRAVSGRKVLEVEVRKVR
ncbi:MAG: HlyC/CorC family transporter [Spirochaetales bacterium]|nr:HlyC/CorC family transporter [Spirochaetales bacterium]